MNLSGQAIYAPKKVYLSKSSTESGNSLDGDQAIYNEQENLKFDEINKQLFELQSSDILHTLSQVEQSVNTTCGDFTETVINDPECDSMESSQLYRQSYIPSPNYDSWMSSTLMPYTLSPDINFENSVRLASPGINEQSEPDLMNMNNVSARGSFQNVELNHNSDECSFKHSTVLSAKSFTQKYGLNLKASVHKPTEQKLGRLDMETFQQVTRNLIKTKRNSKDYNVNSERSSQTEIPLGPTESKRKVNEPVGFNSSSEILSSSQVTSTGIGIGQAYTETQKTPTKQEKKCTLNSEGSSVINGKGQVNFSPETGTTDISSSGIVEGRLQTQRETSTCQVCGDTAAGFYCGAYICEACKKFFMRACKMEKLKYVCLKDKNCTITKESRVQCQYCRYQKCLHLDMYCPGSGHDKINSKKIGEIPCRVCCAPSSGFHFGALTCEGCKGFFRRMAKERECNRYKCSKSGDCEVNTITRNLCKACRYRKCLESGMSIEGSRIGRQPNSIKHAISIEVKMRGKGVCKEEVEEKEVVTIDNLEVKDVEKIEVNAVAPAVEQEKLVIKQEPESPEVIDDTEKINNQMMLDKCMECSTELVGLVPAVSKTDDELRGFSTPEETWKLMMESFEATARVMIKFSKKVPGFRDLLLDDQVKLMQSAVYPIVVLNCSRNYNPETQSFNYFNFTVQQRIRIHTLFPTLKVLNGHFIHTGSMVKLMNLNETEYTMLSILLLLNADVEDLLNPDKVRRLQIDVTFALQQYEENTFGNGSTRFGMLLLRLAELHFILVQHNNAIGSMLKKNPELKVPQLFMEMFGEMVMLR